MQAIAIIPARGGSKRVPRKNLAHFGGQPAIARVIAMARESGVFAAVLVSTDDAEIAQIARGAGATVVVRPAALADDVTPLLPVVQHAIDAFGGGGVASCLILPTAVFLTTANVIDAAARLKADPDLDYVIAVRRFEGPPQRGLRRDANGRVAMLDPRHINTRSQDLEPLFLDAGMMSFGRIAAWRAGLHSFTARTFGLELDRLSAIDIDEPQDLAFAQAVFDLRHGAGSPVLMRCDFFDGSGAGHLKRTTVLARALRAVGLRPVIVLDAQARGMTLPFSVDAEVRHLPDPASLDARGANPEAAQDAEAADAADADATIALAQALGASVVVRDSYRAGAAWEERLARAGLRVAALDDLGTSGAAALAVNYTPGAARPAALNSDAAFLGGARYMITDSARCPARAASATPARVIVHAGYNGAFDRMACVVDAVAAAAVPANWGVTWLCPTPQGARWLAERGVLGPRDAVAGWRTGAIWQGYDLVVGPASTSLYEAVMQGALPVSFAVSDTQTSQRDPWLRIGHALHLTAAEANEPTTVAQLLDLAHDHHGALLRVLDAGSAALDGQGAARVAAAIADLAAGRLDAPQPPAHSAAGLSVRPCTLADAEAFRTARNAPRVRAVSTDPGHVIGWPEHLNWWLTTDTERFVIEEGGVAQAWFWHRGRSHDGRDYLIGGWFPAGDAPVFAAVIRLLQWQLDRTARTHPGHRWIATINRANAAVLALNTRLGFTAADTATQAAARALFPGTGDGFAILQKESGG